MPRSRMIALGLGVAVLAQTACSSSISWPPRPGSCIEASIGKGRHAKWHYQLEGQRVERTSIEHILAAASPRWQSGVRSSIALVHNRSAEEIAALGFGWIAVNATAVFQAGARSVDALIEQLSLLHTRLRAVVG